MVASIVLFLLFNSFDASYFESIKKTIKLNQDEYFVAVYLEPTTCGKCFLEPLDIVKRVQRESPNVKLRIIALIECDRDIEMNIFVKNINWEYGILRDDGTSRRRLGGNTSSILSIFDFSGKQSLHISGGNSIDNAKKVVKFLNKLQSRRKSK